MKSESIPKKDSFAENKLVKKTSSERLFFSVKNKQSFSKDTSFTHFVEQHFVNFVTNNF
jgi:hypothetical protein